MIVFGAFDGHSGGQIALKELGITPSVYYASEIDKFCIAQTQLNFPNTIQLGSIVDIDVSNLGKVDLLLGGSPCQSFSFAGKRKGMATSCDIEITTLEQYLQLKEEGFEFEGQSYLFWEYMRILTEIRKINPDVIFLLENVEMGKKWERVLSEAIGVFGVHINSALVSAQNRRRIYWTNIRTRQEGLFGEVHSDIPQPEDRGILLRDILDDEVDEKYYLSDKVVKRLLPKGKLKKGENKASCITGAGGHGAGNHSDMDLICVAMRGRNACLTPTRTEYGKSIRKDYEAGRVDEKRANIQKLEPRGDGKTNCLTSVTKDNLIIQLNPSKESGGIQPYQQNRVYDVNGKSPVLMAQMSCGSHAIGNIYDNGHNSQAGRVYSVDGKSATLSSDGGGGGAKTGLYLISSPMLCKSDKRLLSNLMDVDGKTNSLLATSYKGAWANGMTLVGELVYHNMMPRSSKTGKGGTGHLSRNDGKTYCLDTGQTNAVEYDQRIRRLTPTECARLQTIPEWYQWECSESQQYRMLGNGWTVEVVKHIFSFLNLNNNRLRA